MRRPDIAALRAAAEAPQPGTWLWFNREVLALLDYIEAVEAREEATRAALEGIYEKWTPPEYDDTAETAARAALAAYKDEEPK